MAQLLALSGSPRQAPVCPQVIEAAHQLDLDLPINRDVLQSQRTPLAASICSSELEYYDRLDFHTHPLKHHLTHIICTIGPASRDVEILNKLMDAGMNICRLNFSHGTYDYHRDTIRNIREVSTRRDRSDVVAIALDTKGPEIRTGLLEAGTCAEIILENGANITLTTNAEWAEKCNADTVWVDYQGIVDAVDVGGLIYVDDGLITLKVKRKSEDSLSCSVVNGGALGSKKGCNLPGTSIDLPAVSEKDKEDILFALDQDLDMIFASFIQDGRGIQEIRGILGERGRHIKIIAKLENQAGINNLREIVAEADGIMVARGDMGIEIPPEKVFLAQKMMISICNKMGKPVICATQMLESMTYKPRATRAESNDVANAVFDGADCVMLSGESAKGSYPFEAVTHMAAVCCEAEAVLFSDLRFAQLRCSTPLFIDSAHTIALAAVDASLHSQAAAIVTTATSGRHCSLLACYRPRCPIIMVTRSAVVARQSLLHRAIVPLFYAQVEETPREEEIKAQLRAGIDKARRLGLLAPGDTVILTVSPQDADDKFFSMQIIRV